MIQQTQLMIENKWVPLMIEDKCSIIGIDMPCIGGEIGKICKTGGATICPSFNKYLERAFFGAELDEGTRELMANPEESLTYALSLMTTARRESKKNDR
jgi:hypothetical protein